jgi:hypothetical protein
MDEHSASGRGPDFIPDRARSNPADRLVVAVVQGPLEMKNVSGIMLLWPKKSFNAKRMQPTPMLLTKPKT